MLGTVSIVISVVDRVSARMGKIGQNLIGVDSKVARLSSGLRTAGMMFTAFAAMATAAIGDIVKKSMDYWIALKRTGVIAGWTASQTTAMRVTVSALAMEFAAFGVTQKEVAEGMYHVASAGLVEELELKKLTRLALEMKALHGIELPAATDILTTVFRVFGYTTEDVWQAANTMNYAILKSKLTFDALTDTMKYAAPLAKLAGWSFEGLMSGIMAMANAGIRGSKAGTALRAVVTRLAAPPAKARKAFRDLNIEIFQLDDNARKIKVSLDAAGQQMSRLEEQTAETEDRIKSLQSTMSRFGIEERKIRLQISGMRLRAAAEDRDLTAEEEENIRRLELAAEGLGFQNETLAIQEEELGLQTKKLKSEMEEVSDAEEELSKAFNSAKGAMLPLPELLSTIGNALLGMSVQERLATIEAIGGKRALAGLAAMLMAEVPALASAEMQQSLLNLAMAEGEAVTDTAAAGLYELTGAVTAHAEAMKEESAGTQEASSTTEMLASLTTDELIVAYGKLHKEEMQRIDSMLGSVDAMLTAIETQIVMAKVMTTFYKVLIAVIGKLGAFGAYVLVLGGPMLLVIALLGKMIWATGIYIKMKLVAIAKTIASTLVTWLHVTANIAYLASIFIIGLALAAAVIGMVLYIKSTMSSTIATQRAEMANINNTNSIRNQGDALNDTSGELAGYESKLASLQGKQDSLRNSFEKTEHTLTGGSLVDSLEEGTAALGRLENRTAKTSSGLRLMVADLSDIERRVDTLRGIGVLRSAPTRGAYPSGGGTTIEKIEVSVTTGPITGAADADEVGRRIGEKIVEEVRRSIA